MADVSGELARLAELRDRGVLTDAEFATQKASLLTGNQASAASKKKTGGCISTIAVLAVILLVLYFVGNGQKAKDDAARSQRPAKSVTARELFKAYANNEVSAQGYYGTKALLISGVVSGVNLDILNKPVVLLETDNQFMSAQASLVDADQSKARGLTKGDKVTLRCEDVSEVASIPMLRVCTIK